MRTMTYKCVQLAGCHAADEPADMAFRNVFSRSLEGVAQLPSSFKRTFGTCSTRAYKVSSAACRYCHQNHVQHEFAWCHAAPRRL